MVFISFIQGKPLINGGSKWSGLKYTSQVEKDNTVVKKSIVHIVKGWFYFIHTREPLINGNPKFVWFKIQFLARDS